MKILFRSTAIFISIFLIVVNLSACGEDATTDLQSFSDSKSSISTDTPSEILNDIYTKDERQAIEKHISEATNNAYSKLSTPGIVLYSMCPKECDELSEIGLRGAPLLFTDLIDRYSLGTASYQSYQSHLYYAEVLCAILRTDTTILRGFYNDLLKKDPNITNCDSFGKECVSSYYADAKERIPEIIASNDEFSDKAMKLITYGVFAIPYVVREIEKGNTEYEQIFVGLGLHIDVPELKRRMPNYFLSWQERFDSEAFLKGSENFDYKVWYEENKEDLDNLFKFLDAYCAEYEAENK